jgi:hypothetical protein
VKVKGKDRETIAGINFYADFILGAVRVRVRVRVRVT